MTLDDINALVRLAGLERTQEKFPDDLAEAAASAAALRAALPRSPGPDLDRPREPWPPPLEEEVR